MANFMMDGFPSLFLRVQVWAGSRKENDLKQKIESPLPIFCLILPWIVDRLVLALAFLLRPEFGSGYIAFIGVAVGVVMLLSALFVADCFVTILTAPVAGDLAGLLFVILMVVGLYYLADFATQIFRSWRSSHKDTPQ